MRVLWFRRDLRLSDNKAMYELEKALSEDSDATWVAIFHLDSSFLNEQCLHHAYFFQNVKAFEEECESNGIHLYYIYGDVHTAFSELIYYVPEISDVYFNEDEASEEANRDTEISDYLSGKGVKMHSFKDAHFHDSSEVRKKDGEYYEVFTPYLKKWRTLQKPRPYPCYLAKWKDKQASLSIPQTKKKDILHDFIYQSEVHWNAIYESDAHTRLDWFLKETLMGYDEERDKLESDGTSKLSPFIKTGRISVRTIYDSMASSIEEGRRGAEAFLTELAWRDFYNMIHVHYPYLKKQELKEKYRNMQWKFNEEQWEKWKKGETGFPIVDAAMRQLNSEGWLHNRGRMIAASFLVKDYLFDWRRGEDYFRKQLIDYDSSSNPGGWQWAASTGTDAVPYFRVFSPTRQSERFDPKGTYIKRYIPELKDVPVTYIHEPWKIDSTLQEQFHCILDQDYPKPDIDHKAARTRAINIFKGV
ncbi:deoxyribodipyrimidine photo-lyase [Salibacterium salarium]|uniref:cryptochrome/photolyase family protein n=1 Tax=Salibacterium salarium TaxID=284579 RepID=UPI00278ABF93|nr:deoxyribodipyrimidine photo-lyase [Salibacterium salarium]MDQ0298991.1 deoxyribodipyrimidine photo-lyase [Salibacterium salarium]